MSAPAPICSHCEQPASLTTGAKVYPHRPDLHSLRFWRCDPCDAHVGCHRKDAWVVIGGVKVVSDGTLALGRPANAALRKARNAAHAAFDPLWRDGPLPRRAAYAWLAKGLGISVEQCHIATFDLAQCQRVLELVKSRATA